jgi:hypothetical protein
VTSTELFDRHLRTAVRSSLFAAGVLSLATWSAGWAAPVVVTPNSLAGYAFFPPASSAPGAGMQETLQTCFVEPARGDRTIAMSSRFLGGSSRPLTVFYQLVGGGGGGGRSPGSLEQRFGGAGGSSTILKNGTVVAAASGAPSATAATATSSGQLQVGPSDTLRFDVGGGGGGGYRYYNYTGVYTYYALPAGGGAGYFGGGAGSNDALSAPFGNAPDLAQGGTASAGGRGGLGQGCSGNGGSNAGGSALPGASGGNGATQGSNGAGGGWDGYRGTSYQSGGGGAVGRDGTWGGWTWCPSPYDPSASPSRTSRPNRPSGFALDPWAGSAGFMYLQNVPGGFYDCVAGGVAGQVVLQYQAPTCDAIPNWDQP